MNIQIDQWDKPQKILVVLAHPDDPEFFCGASIAKWTKSGHQVNYCLMTCGDKGTKDRYVTPSELCDQRQLEQIEAAKLLGVQNIRFLGYPDGYLFPDLDLRRDITRVIRQEKPDILVTCDPTTLYIGTDRLNHPDHRAAGQATIDAVFPAARDHLYFIDLLDKERLEPHNVRELWISGSLNPNIVIDVTDYWELKIQAILRHSSQITDIEDLVSRMRNRVAEGSAHKHPRYEEKYLRLIFD